MTGAVHELLLLLEGNLMLVGRNALLDDDELDGSASGGGVGAGRDGARCAPSLHPQGARPQQQPGGYGGKGGYGGYGGNGGNGG
jgi:hypothetical protein